MGKPSNAQLDAQFYEQAELVLKETLEPDAVNPKDFDPNKFSSDLSYRVQLGEYKKGDPVPGAEAPQQIDTGSPTGGPTDPPTEEETGTPTDTPPTEAPTADTDAPTAADTDAPTAADTEAPTAADTDAPTAADTDVPTVADTDAPTTATESPTPLDEGTIRTIEADFGHDIP